MQKTKNFSLLLFSLLFFICAVSQVKQKTTATNKVLENHILVIVKAFQQKDAATINSYIDSTIVCYKLPPYGTIHNLVTVSGIDFSDYDFTPSNFGAYSLKKKILKYATLPNYDCDKSKWNKRGLFASKSKFVSTILATLIKDKFGDYTNKDLNHSLDIEKNSYWVLYAPDNATAISFQITNWKGKYYITAIETAPLYCDI